MMVWRMLFPRTSWPELGGRDPSRSGRAKRATSDCQVDCQPVGLMPFCSDIGGRPRAGIGKLASCAVMTAANGDVDPPPARTGPWSIWHLFSHRAGSPSSGRRSVIMSTLTLLAAGCSRRPLRSGFLCVSRTKRQLRSLGCNSKQWWRWSRRCGTGTRPAAVAYFRRRSSKQRGGAGMCQIVPAPPTAS